MENLSSKEMKAIEKLYSELNLDTKSIENDYNSDYLTLNTTRSGKEVAYYMDETNCKAIYVDTLEFLTDSEIEEELA